MPADPPKPPDQQQRLANNTKKKPLPKPKPTDKCNV